MSIENPATPAPAATPGSNEQGQSTTPPVSTPPAATTPGTGGQPEGQVTISTKEYADLQRAKARAASADRRNALRNRQSPGNTTPVDPDDATAQEIAQLRQETAEKDRLLMRERLTNKVRNILEKEEFKVLPKSTRDLILRNPSTLSEADNEEEALLDIEDYVREQVAELSVPLGTPPRSHTPPEHETPPKVGGGAPAHAKADVEDTSRLQGNARAMATLRNTLRKSGNTDLL